MKIAVKISIAALMCTLVSCSTISPEAQKKYQEALSAWKQGNQDQAIADLKAATQDSPKYYQAHLRLGEYYLAKENYELADGSFMQAISIDPQNPEAYLKSGEMYLDRAKTHDDYLKAQHKFSQALKLPGLKPEQEFRGNLGKGICKLRSTEIREARPYLEKAAKLQPDSLRVIFYQAVLNENEMKGANTRSIEMYEKVLAKEPKHQEALMRLGKAYEQLDYTHKAVEYYQKYLKAGGKSKEISAFVAKNEPKPDQEKEKIMTCPDCGRIGKKGDTYCIWCNIPLVETKQE